MSLQQIKNDSEMREYFDRLPLMIQESIAQSGAVFTNIQQLKKVVWNLERFQDDGVEQ